jgi:hypothetical protein
MAAGLVKVLCGSRRARSSSLVSTRALPGTSPESPGALPKKNTSSAGSPVRSDALTTIRSHWPRMAPSGKVRVMRSAQQRDQRARTRILSPALRPLPDGCRRPLRDGSAPAQGRPT